MYIRLRHSKEEAELQNGGQGACATRFNRQSDEAVHHEAAAFKRFRPLFDAIQLWGSQC